MSRHVLDRVKLGSEDPLEAASLHSLLERHAVTQCIVQWRAVVTRVPADNNWHLEGGFRY